jgi:hypothetical protein
MYSRNMYLQSIDNVLSSLVTRKIYLSLIKMIMYNIWRALSGNHKDNHELRGAKMLVAVAYYIVYK